MQPLLIISTHSYNFLKQTMDTVTFQDFLLKLSLHTSIIKHSKTYPTQKVAGKIHRKMEQNLPAMAEKFWHILRLTYFVLRKNISKPKLLADLNVMMRSRKISGKGAGEDGGGFADERRIPPDVYEFSCSNTPAHHAFRLPFQLNKRKRSPSPSPSEEEIIAAAMEIVGGEEPSPALPGFGRTPMVRQLRVTDSPFPVMEAEEDDGRVDEAAERFIRKFYRDLKRQNTVAS